MKPAQVLEKLDRERTLAAVYYLYGPESYFVERILEKILAIAFPDGAGRDLNYTILSGAEIKGEAVVRDATTLPMFSPTRVIVLREIQQTPAQELKPLAQYVKTPARTTTLVLCATRKLSSQNVLAKALSSKRAVLVDCRHPYERDLPGWIRAMAKAREITLDYETERFLVESVGTSLDGLDDAIERLRLFAGPGARVDIGTARQCIADTRVHEIWDLTNAIGERNLVKSLKILSKLRSEGLEALSAIGMLARTMRQLFTVKSLGSAASRPDTVAKTLGLPPFVAKKVASQARRFSLGDIIAAMEALRDADLTIKSSDLPSSVKDWVVLESLVWTMATPGRRG